MEKNDFFLIAGPCVVESKELCMLIAEKLCRLAEKYKIPFLFKASFRKDNRTRFHSFTGIGDQEGLEIIRSVKEHFQIPVTTDIHTPDQAQMVSDYGIDLIQIPAFLCRQTSLLKAAAQTGRAVNVKKGQFLAPEQMSFVVEKLMQFGTSKEKIMVTERGTQFGYKDLVFDVRSIPAMKNLGVPVVMDVTHSVQAPNQEAGVAGGCPDMIFTMAATALAAGADALFIETHPAPQEALSDGSNMLLLSKMDELLQQALAFRNTYLKLYS
ncbi:MAG: 3-deoxy-8-phosphooctulonate synthase [Bacteroidales bacterium]|nr:3-deoxy-8-phosphooctulonate synthase [Bacteroidales bacterium]